MAPERFAISLVGSKYDNHPRRDLATWDDLVARLTKPRRTDCTVADCGTGIHADFDRDGNVIGCRHKNGPGWIPATFSTGRKKTTAELISMLVVDADHLPDDAALQETLGKLARYSYIAHATHSDRPGDRCARIALPLSQPVPSADWPRFWDAAMASLGMPADPSCCDASRLYFLPARPNDADFWFEVHDGEPIDVGAIVASAPPVAPTIARSLEMNDSGAVGPGQRHAMLKSLAGSMRFRGAGLVEIEAALLLANQHRCDPPKSEAAVKDIATWAAAQPVSSLPPPPRSLRAADIEADLLDFEAQRQRKHEEPHPHAADVDPETDKDDSDEDEEPGTSIHPDRSRRRSDLR
ncbi:MAG TPA: hypothetical protein VN253_14000 [Kofleriaceae bacterium]|nr:hypothetical protein [Kofleriaceae bacterium]